MNLQHIIFQYLVEEETRPSLEDPAYNAAEDARDAAEQDLKSALTGKQRRLLTEFRKREDELSLMQLRHMLSHCTLCLSAGALPRRSNSRGHRVEGRQAKLVDCHLAGGRGLFWGRAATGFRQSPAAGFLGAEAPGPPHQKPRPCRRRRQEIRSPRTAPRYCCQ